MLEAAASRVTSRAVRTMVNELGVCGWMGMGEGGRDQTRARAGPAVATPSPGRTHAGEGSALSLFAPSWGPVSRTSPPPITSAHLPRSRTVHRGGRVDAGSSAVSAGPTPSDSPKTRGARALAPDSRSLVSLVLSLPRRPTQIPRPLPRAGSPMNTHPSHLMSVCACGAKDGEGGGKRRAPKN